MNDITIFLAVVLFVFAIFVFLRWIAEIKRRNREYYDEDDEWQ